MRFWEQGCLPAHWQLSSCLGPGPSAALGLFCLRNLAFPSQGRGEDAGGRLPALPPHVSKEDPHEPGKIPTVLHRVQQVLTAYGSHPAHRTLLETTRPAASARPVIPCSIPASLASDASQSLASRSQILDKGRFGIDVMWRESSSSRVSMKAAPTMFRGFHRSLPKLHATIRSTRQLHRTDEHALYGLRKLA